MSTNTSAYQKKQRRHARVRSRVSGTSARPRLAVFRSNKHIYAQIIDDVAGKTLVSLSDLKLKGEQASAPAIGEAIAKLALAKKIKQVAFDRGGYIYAGRIKQVAEGARAGGLEF